MTNPTPKLVTMPRDYAQTSWDDSGIDKRKAKENNKLAGLVQSPDGVPFGAWLGMTILFLPVFPLIWIFLAIIHTGRKNRAATYYAAMRAAQENKQ